MEQKPIGLSLRAGINLRHLIKERYGSQELFAEKFGADVRTVGRWINRGIDSLTTVERIAAFLHIDVGVILSP